MQQQLQTTMADEKRRLRQQMLDRRKQMAHATMATASQAVARHFADHPILSFAPSFAGYISIRSELDVLPIFDIMERYPKQTALPCAAPQKTLIFRRWERGEPLLRHPTLNTLEPERKAAAIIPAIVLVPLLAFDPYGNRLGYGGGYYDRTMEHLRRFETPPQFIGVGYGSQEVSSIPVDENDQRLDGILTELGVSMFS